MTNFLWWCPKREQRIHVIVCHKYCRHRESCENLEQFEIDQMIAEEVEQEKKVMEEIEKRFSKLQSEDE